MLSFSCSHTRNAPSKWLGPACEEATVLIEAFCLLQEQEKSSCPAMLKKQTTEQDFSGGVAVIAILHRPDTTPNDTPSPSPSCPSPNQEESGSPQDSVPLLSTTLQQTSPNQNRMTPPVTLYVANVGDCRAVLCRAGKAVTLTKDHTPSVPGEAARVEAAGGFVSRGRVNGILGVTRSFGDIHCKVCFRYVCVFPLTLLLFAALRVCVLDVQRAAHSRIG